MQKSISLVSFEDSYIHENYLQNSPPGTENNKNHKEFYISIIKNPNRTNDEHFLSIGKLTHKTFAITKNSLSHSKQNLSSDSLLINQNTSCYHHKKQFIIQTIPKNTENCKNKEILNRNRN